MATDAAHRRWWQIFEVIFGLPLLAAVGLHAAFPFSLPRSLLTPVAVTAGAALIVVGATLAVLARRELARQGQPTDPGQPTTKVITSGVFSISRNPLYLGGICLLAGIALAANFPWGLALLLPALVGCHYLLIAPEERYLAAKFGEPYRLYAASVHRWVGRSRPRK